jgi:hypothetical protein
MFLSKLNCTVRVYEEPRREVEGGGRRGGTFLDEMSISSLACNPFRICFADMVCRSLVASMPSMIALYCAFSEGSTILCQLIALRRGLHKIQRHSEQEKQEGREEKAYKTS